MRSAPKKRGTAATKKSSKKAKGSKSKAKSTGTSEKGGENEGSSDDETDNGPYCLCRGPDDHRWMISCDVCEDWFHGECVDLSKEIGEKLVERFVCPNCTDGKKNYTKYRKTCALPNCKHPARLYTKALKDRSVFCCNDHCDAWWVSRISTLPTKAASKSALEVLTQEDLIGLLIATADKGGWKLGDKPFGNIEGLWANGLPTRPDVLSEEEQAFLQASSAERLALGNEIVQYKKMMQLLDWANSRRQAALEAGKFTKDSCGYDWRLDTVSVRSQFAAWLDTPEGQAVFKAGKLEAPITTNTNNTDNHNTTATTTNHVSAEHMADPAIRGTCDRKRCKPHAGWYKLLMGVVRVLIKETATAAAAKLEAEEAMRTAAEARYERRQLENNYVEVLSED
ncbi:hypothetical protein F5B22DRAFT_634901 [Xylaria bambusicola]|uniref:uncharacterized protein n=1 Tax=Xylaria bambusicola TaxID=326684 RepID=UPI0020079DD5|nr:uncharacterized protein F5B22DRAFT_634901 [Xylaria bambusicola]KAI0521089.1 hypothetical protein F5B22DRAFT_634901 [Xylaria bambusicola]